MDDIKKFKILIGQNKIKECFMELEKFLSLNAYSEIENDLILIKSSFESIKKKNNLNLIEPTTIQIEENKIKFALIELIDSIRISIKVDGAKREEVLSKNDVRGVKLLRIELVKLEEALKNFDFKKADLITTNMFILNQNSDIQDASLNQKSILDFPFQIFHKMDSLWLEYTNHKHGFSLQRDIWLSINGNNQNVGVKTLNKFAEYVGWQSNGDWIRKYDEINFKLNFKMGHLPSMRQHHLDNSSSWWIAWRDNISAVLQISNKLP